MRGHHLGCLAAIVLTVLATPSWGFQEDRPAHAQFRNEQPQAELAKEQSFQGRVPVVGELEDQSALEPASGQLGSDDDPSMKTANVVADRRSLDQASRTITEAGRPRPWWALACVLVGLLVTVGVGVKSYMDKIAPVPDRFQ